MPQQALEETANSAGYFMHCSSIGRKKEAVSHFLIQVPTISLHLHTTQEVLAAAIMIGIVILVKERKEVLWKFVTKFPNNGREMVQSLFVFWF